MFTLDELAKVIPLVRASVPPTPQYAWPLLKDGLYVISMLSPCAISPPLTTSA
jgi:hypothetical protein